MNYFEKAFGRSRKTNYKNLKPNKGLFGVFKSGIKEYIKYYVSAQQSYSSGNYNKSLELINKTIEDCDFDDWKQRAFKANVFEDLKIYQSAIKEYEIAIDICNNDINTYALYHQIGFCYLSLGDNNKAISFYTYAIELKKSHPNTEFNLDVEGMDSGVMLGIKFNRMYNNRANAFKNINKLNEAFEDCKTSLSFDKNYSNPYLMLSQIFSKAGKEPEAIKYLKIAAELGNKNAISMVSQIR